MNADPLSPMQEFIADRARGIAAGAKLNGSQGAMSRLMQRLDTTEVTDWIDAELKRGTKMEEVADGLANYIANMIAPLCVPVGPNCHRFAMFVLGHAMEAFREMTEADNGVEALIVHRHTGAEHVGTVHGFARQGVPKT